MTKQAYRMLLALFLCVYAFGGTAAFADEGDDFSQETVDEQTETNFFAGLEEMEFDELAFKLVKLEAVQGNEKIADDHFKAVAVIQNTSPYTIRHPATAIELVDPKGNSIALAYLKLDLTLTPGQSKWAPVEFESQAEVTAGQNVKTLKVGMYDSLYGERVDDNAELTGKGVYLFINDKPLKVKVADPSGYQYVPAKNLLEQMGFQYVWNAKTSTFTAVKGKLKMEHKIGSRQWKVNGKIVKLDGGQTAMVNKVPMVSIDTVMMFSSNWLVSKGYHEDVTVIAMADLEGAK